MSRIIAFIQNLNIPKPMWYLVGGALLFRLWGIWYGLPLQINIDEPSIISATSSLKDNYFHPMRFDWPSLYFYMNAVAYFVYVSLRSIVGVFINLPDVFYTPAALFFVSRLLSALFGALTLIPIFIISRMIFDKKVGYIAAIILMILPVHVYESHFAKLDIAHTFFVAIAVFWIYKIYKEGNRRAFIWTGIFIGIATSIKYNAALLFVPAIIAYLMRRFEVEGLPWYKKFGVDKPSFINFLYSGLISIATFYIGSPYALIDYKTFFSDEYGIGAMWQFQNVGRIGWVDYPEALRVTFWEMFRNDLGIWLWLLLMVLIILFLFFNKRSKPYVFLMLPTILFSFYVSKLERSPSHYFLMIIPFYLPAIAAFIMEILDRMTKLNIKNRILNDKNLLLVIFLAVILIPSVLTAVEYNIRFSRADTRNLAYNWVQDNLDEDDFLFVYGENIETIIFKEGTSQRLSRFDRGAVGNKSVPFYFLVSSSEISVEELTTDIVDYSPDGIRGNNAPLLTNSELLFYTDNDFRFGQPIFILKINEVIPD